MSTIGAIKEQIQLMPAGDPFSAAFFSHLGTPDNIRKILGRLVADKEIRRVTRGVFVRPKQIEGIGELLPAPNKVLKVVAQATGEKIAMHGAEAARRLKLTTHVPLQRIMYTTGTSRKITIGKMIVTLKHISSRKLVAPETKSGMVISALWYLGRHNVTAKTIQTIERQLTEKEFKTTLKEVARMPAWMANIFYQYNQRGVTK